jgi:hypothetical protein
MKGQYFLSDSLNFIKLFSDISQIACLLASWFIDFCAVLNNCRLEEQGTVCAAMLFTIDGLSTYYTPPLFFLEHFEDK